ncbi:MAG TPA: GNAT family N-acetyltransferase [Candidatus Baltobacteraceae bacterium]|nr:GNAT family N-acetyltransferase [Candidatus Baltobacteraceae bacterium]
MPLTVRTATPDDLDAIAPLFDAYRQFFTEKPDLEVSRRFLGERLQRDESVVLAAFDGIEAAGFLQLYPLFSSWYCKRQWFLSDLYVDERFRERGIGKHLVSACIDFAKRGAARAILVELPFSEPHLVEFYGKLGFTKDSVFDLYRLVAE